MTPEEFDAAWAAIEARLTPEQMEIVTTCINGSEVNHTAIYTLMAFALGVAFGGLL